MKSSLFSLVAILGAVSARPADNVPTPTLNKRTTVTYAGINIAGFDMGCTTLGACALNGLIPPLTSLGGPDGLGQMNHFVKDDGLNAFRLPVAWQYLVNNPGDTLNPTNTANYDQLVQGCLNSGASLCIIDVHNYARWNNAIIGQGGPSDGQFASLWTQIAQKYKSQSRIAFAVMNEPHDLPSEQTWANTVQAAVTAIRNAGATSQYILIPGTHFANAQYLPTVSGPLLQSIHNLDGSTTNIIFDVHRYLDVDNSGTHSECTTNSIDVLSTLATWLRNGNRHAFLTETGGGNTDSCVTDFCQELTYLNQNADVYLGFTSWAAGSFGPQYVPNYALLEVPTYANGVWTDQLLVKSCVVADK